MNVNYDVIPLRRSMLSLRTVRQGVRRNAVCLCPVVFSRLVLSVV